MKKLQILSLDLQQSCNEKIKMLQWPKLEKALPSVVMNHLQIVANSSSNSSSVFANEGM